MIYSKIKYSLPSLPSLPSKRSIPSRSYPSRYTNGSGRYTTRYGSYGRSFKGSHSLIDLQGTCSFFMALIFVYIMVKSITSKNQKNKNEITSGKTYYKILGVSSDASMQEIKIRYRNLAWQYHPDRNKSNAEKFKEISAAYDTLKDKDTRKAYDDSLKMAYFRYEQDFSWKEFLYDISPLLFCLLYICLYI
jgi:hypothetical protein